MSNLPTLNRPQINISYQFVYVLLISCLCGLGFRGLPTQPWSYDDLLHIEVGKKAQTDFSHVFDSSAKEPTRWTLNIYFFLAYRIFGEAPSGYHTVNIFLHTLNSLLCAQLCLVLFHKPIFASLNGILFAIHCAPYEAVYEISASGILIGTAFAIICVLFSLKFLMEGKIQYLLGATGAFATAVLSYETLVSIFLPILFLCWKYGKQNRYRPWWLPVLLLGVAGLLALLDVLVYQTATWKMEFNAITFGFHAPYNLFFFVSRLLINAHFTPFGWDIPAPFDVPLHLFDWYAFGGGLLLACLIYISRRSAEICFYTIWSISTLIPYIFGTNQSYFPRYWYLATVGGTAITSYLILWPWSRFQVDHRIQFATLSTLLILLVGLSFHKMKIFEGRFLLHAANYCLSHEENSEKAIDYYTRVLSEYHIRNGLLFFNLGIAYLNSNRHTEALRMLREANQLRPDHDLTILNIGYVLYQQGRISEAVQAYSQAVKMTPAFITDIRKIGFELYTRKDIENALRFYYLAIQVDPSNDSDYFNIGVLLQIDGKVDEAVQAYRKVLLINPNHSSAKTNIETLLESQVSP